MKTVATCQNCGMTWTPTGLNMNTNVSPQSTRQPNNPNAGGIMNNITNEVKKMPKWAIALCIVGVFFVLMIFCAIASLVTGDSDKRSGTEASQTAEEEKVVVDSDIDNFEYEISGKKIEIQKYKGSENAIEVKKSYKVDGKKYKTDLSDFRVDKDSVKVIVFAEGIKEVNNSVFNSSEVEKIYFPSTMKVVYDNTLAYLHPDDGEEIEIYYAGTKKEWKKIFTEYERKKFDETEGAEEKGKSAADKLNELVGMKYDENDFKYFFSAKPEDLY